MDVRPPAARAPLGPEPRRAFVLAVAANDNESSVQPPPLPPPTDELAAWFSDIGAACRRLAATDPFRAAPAIGSAGGQRLTLDAFGPELASLVSGFRPSLDSMRPTGK
jgi:hypothetical protein